MRIAFDTGGTFTDCVYLRGGHVEILKIPSTSRRPVEAISEAIDRVRSNGTEVSHLDLVCGTTVGTNALLQRQGGRIALVTTRGFEDVLEIGRQARPRLYNLLVQKAEPLVPTARRFGLGERLDANGRILVRPSRSEIARTVRAVVRSGAESVAVCLLFSYINPAHEKLIVRSLAAAGLDVSASYEIFPEYREFERASTTVINAYLVPVMSEYLAQIGRIANRYSPGDSYPPRRASDHATSGRVRIMQSNGGILSAGAAAREPVRTILSGPAGGVLGAQYVSQLAGFNRIITLDMGGTSTDVSLMESGSLGSPTTTSETIISGLPVAVPMLDIHTVGSGGGSLARFDRAGALRVGPESAGADPGPICYGHGTKPTVTDANLILGRLPSSGLLGGSFPLDLSRTWHYMNRERGPLGSVEGFAQGIVDVSNSIMEKAVRVISVERGHDPRDYTLVAFGGAGALHACDLAASLEIPRVLVPCLPGALSALGILRADVTKDFSRTIRLDVRNPSHLRARLRRPFVEMEREIRKQMRLEGFAGGDIHIDRGLDVRYSGQSYDLTVAFAGDIIAAFHRAHKLRFGYSDPSRPCEVVNIRARVTVRTPKPALPKWKVGGASAADAAISKCNLMYSGRRFHATVYDRSKLKAGNRISGPAVITEYSATTFIPPAWAGHLDLYGNLLLEPAHRGGPAR